MWKSLKRTWSVRKLQIELKSGWARRCDTLPQLESEKRGSFDLVFIDADKQHNTEYFQWALKLSRVGSLIVVDNVVRDGKVTDGASSDASVQGVRRCNAAMAAEKRVEVTGYKRWGAKATTGFRYARGGVNNREQNFCRACE